MERLRATVRGGRLVMDMPTALPEGTVLDLVIDDEGDDLANEERAALHAASDRAFEEVKAGKARPADEVMLELRIRRAGDPADGARGS